MKCDKCKFKSRPKNIYPCDKCENEPPITCLDCRYSYYECRLRGKNQRKLRICENFKWS